MADANAAPQAENEVADPQAENEEAHDASDLESDGSESVPADSSETENEEQDSGSGETDEERAERDRQAKLAYENRELKRRLAAQESKSRQDQIEQIEAELQNPKTLEDFDGDQREYARYMAQLGPMAIKLDNLKAQSQSPYGEDSLAEGADDFAQREVEFAVQHPDYFQRAYDRNVPITREMAQFIRDADNGVEMFYHLANSREECAQIANLPPHAVASAMRAMSIRLQGQAPGKAVRDVPPNQGTGAGQTPGGNVSKAPPPASTLEGSGNSGRSRIDPKDPDSDKLSDEEWFRRRNREMEAKRRKR